MLLLTWFSFQNLTQRKNSLLFAFLPFNIALCQDSASLSDANSTSCEPVFVRLFLSKYREMAIHVLWYWRFGFSSFCSAAFLAFSAFGFCSGWTGCSDLRNRKINQLWMTFCEFSWILLSFRPCFWRFWLIIYQLSLCREADWTVFAFSEDFRVTVFGILGFSRVSRSHDWLFRKY